MVKAKLVRISQLLPEGLMKQLDALVEVGLYPNRSEAIRLAIHDLIMLHQKP